MSQRTFRTRRRVVGALLAGVTALGAAGIAALAGGGVANAATVSAASGGLSSGASATTILPTQSTAASAGNLTISFTGTPASGDSITLTILPNGGSCSTTNYIEWETATASTGWSTAAPSVGDCGAGIDNVLTVNAGSGATSTSSVTLSSITVESAGASTGAAVINGKYVLTGSAGAVTFSVGSDVTVTGVTVTPSTPLSTVATSTKNVSIGNITLTAPSASAVGSDYVCVTLNNSATWDSFSGTPTVTQSNGAATTSGGSVVSAGNVQVQDTTSGAATTQSKLLTFQVTGTASSTAPSFVISSAHADGGSTAGPVTATVGTSSTQSGCNNGGTSVGSGEVFVIGASTTPIAGQYADATTAQEFEAAFVTTSTSNNTVTYTCSNNDNAVLATDVDPYDALSAAYLEGELGTGVLITQPTSLDTNTLAALKEAGVTRVYVVGGLDAVTQADITALEATPAYNCGGQSQTGANIQVYSGISGETADDTAVAIDNYITTVSQSLPSISSAYSAESTYNQTSGNESSAAPSSSSPTTAFVVADNDWSDAAAAAGLAWKYHIPVILTPPTSLGTQASSELTKLSVNQAIVFGGQLALSNNVVTSIQALNITVLRIAGADKTQTAADVAQFEGKVLSWDNTTVYVAQGSKSGWSDALGAAALSGKNTGALLLTESPTQGEGSYTDAVLKLAGTPSSGLGNGVTTTIQVLGGSLAVTQSTITSMQNALASGA